MNPISERFGALLGREYDGPEVSRERDALVIDCRGCRLAPLPGSDECVRCMVDAMCEHGGADRVVLRTGRDIEVSGRAGRAIRDVASVRRWSYSHDRCGVRCRACPVSREAVMDAAWAAFPRDAAAEGRRVLDGQEPAREECSGCTARTSAALDQVESGIARVVAEMTSACGVLR